MQSQTQLPYFSKNLPWQQMLWQHLVVNNQTGKLPHAMLASGMEGIGKRTFVWRWVAWQLCLNKGDHSDSACGSCESCQWLAAGTHPDLQVLPLTSLPIAHEHVLEETSKPKKKKSKNNDAHKKITTSIKIDDIRAIQDFVNRGSSNIRICVFDEAHKMTIGAANALLKTLEEPSAGIQIILITDKPNMLLPTIKSRVQQLPLNDINEQQAISYVKQELNVNSSIELEQLLKLTANAPLAAVKMATTDWYSMRELWLTTWLALRSGSRTSITASEFWQTKLGLHEFIKLSQLMLLDIQRLICGLNVYQQDIDFSVITKSNFPPIESCSQFQDYIHSLQKSLYQNVQDKIGYDGLMAQLSML